MVIFPHTHSKYRSLESRIDWQNDRTNTEQLERRLPLLHYCISHRKLLFLLFFFHCHPSDPDPRRPAYPSCRDRGGRRPLSCPSANRAGFVTSQGPLQSFGGQSLSISPGSSLSGWQLYQKKKNKTTYTGTHVKMRESNNPTERKCRCSHKIFYV